MTTVPTIAITPGRCPMLTCVMNIGHIHLNHNGNDGCRNFWVLGGELSGKYIHVHI